MKHPPVQVPTIELLVPIRGDWLSLADRRATPTLLFEHYLNPATDLDEVVAAALLVRAGGKPWNSVDASEGLHHIAYWLMAVSALVEGAPSTFIWAWEESGMTAFRQNELIVLEERTHHREFQLPPVCFELRRFARKLLDATKPGVDLEQELTRLAGERFPEEWRAATTTNSPQPPAAYAVGSQPMRIRDVIESLTASKLAETWQRLSAIVGAEG